MAEVDVELDQLLEEESAVVQEASKTASTSVNSGIVDQHPREHVSKASTKDQREHLKLKLTLTGC